MMKPQSLPSASFCLTLSILLCLEICPGQRSCNSGAFMVANTLAKDLWKMLGKVLSTMDNFSSTAVSMPSNWRAALGSGKLLAVGIAQLDIQLKPCANEMLHQRLQAVHVEMSLPFFLTSGLQGTHRQISPSLALSLCIFFSFLQEAIRGYVP